MQALIKDLLSFSRALDSAGPADAFSDSNRVLTVAMENLCHAIQENCARIVIEAQLPEAPMHQSHLLQLLQNLIGNSLKYRKPDVAPLVRISASQDRSNVLFCVSDNGIGIAPQYHQRVFGVFKRLNHSQPGNGIGLAVCKRIVEHYSGNIWLESQERQGARFFFSIPYSRKQGNHS
jgi:light-regulated signal transduction histidine kinase (bacteriophytochrome)